MQSRTQPVNQTVRLSQYSCQPDSEEQPTVERLHKFIEENGYKLAGVHEEEYLTSPKAKVQKTIIRYPIKRK